jgi:hypothetical protein
MGADCLAILPLTHKALGEEDRHPLHRWRCIRHILSFELGLLWPHFLQCGFAWQPRWEPPHRCNSRSVYYLTTPLTKRWTAHSSSGQILCRRWLKSKASVNEALLAFSSLSASGTPYAQSLYGLQQLPLAHTGDLAVGLSSSLDGLCLMAAHGKSHGTGGSKPACG